MILDTRSALHFSVATPTQHVLFHAGRVVFASLFILGGVNKVVDPAPSLTMMTNVGVPAPEALIWIVVAVELGLGLIVAAGHLMQAGRWVAPACLLLVLHTLAINILLHPFWDMEGDLARLELSLFFKNISIAGGLVLLSALYPMRIANPPAKT